MVWDSVRIRCVALLFVATLVAGLDWASETSFSSRLRGIRLVFSYRGLPLSIPFARPFPTLKKQEGQDRGLRSGNSPDVSVESVRIPM
jgi:hypothetical protein